MTPEEKFYLEVVQNVSRMASDGDLLAAARVMKREMARYNYVYNFRWLGRPIIQMPPDIMALQELIWEIKPTKIIECGIAHGGSIIFSASMLALLDMANSSRDNIGIKRKVLGIDIEIRPHNRRAIENHFLADYIEMLEGSSIAPETVTSVNAHVRKDDVVMILLDSNHTHDHVFEELRHYAPLVTRGSYCIIADTIIENMPDNFFTDRKWKPGNSPRSAVVKYLKTLDDKALGADGNPLNFENDNFLEAKILFTSAVGGILKRC